MCWLCPIVTPGVPGMVAPATCKPGESKVSWNQIEGSVSCRCGSPASIAPPLVLFEGATAQLLLAPTLLMRL